MNQKILLVEDDISLGDTLSERLEKEKYQVCLARSLIEAREYCHKKSFDLIVLDVGLPDGSGFDFAGEIKAHSKTPFLFITAMADAEYRLKGYELGAEEFIPKPFHLKELLLRIKHVLDNHAPLYNLSFDNIEISFEKLSVQVDNQLNALAAKDFAVLELLIRKSPKVLSRDEILNTVWGEDKFPSQRTIDNTIVRLRALFKEKGEELIRSVRGVGYQWMGPTVEQSYRR